MKNKIADIMFQVAYALNPDSEVLNTFVMIKFKDKFDLLEKSLKSEIQTIKNAYETRIVDLENKFQKTIDNYESHIKNVLRIR
jgi:hypothetical protein